MLRQPMQRFTQMQASDIDIYRNEIRKTKNEIVSIFLSVATTASCLLHRVFRLQKYRQFKQLFAASSLTAEQSA